MLIYLGDLYHDYQRFGSMVPTNVGYIAAYCKKIFGDSVEIVLFKEAGKLISAAKERAPDILGLANYMWNERLNSFVASRVKECNPKALSVVGGPNVRTDREGVGQFLKKYPLVDQYILYGGEKPFARLVEISMEHGGGASVAAKTDVDGCFRLSDGKILGQAYIEAEKDLDFIPSPFLNGMLDPFLEAGHIPLFETNRGCPFSCTFCVWGIAALGKLKTFSMERVTAEMNYVAEKFPGAPMWVLADANFGIMPRDVELSALLRDLYEKTNAFEEVNVWWSKTVTDRTVQIARNLGKLCQAYIAFQSLDPLVLKLIKRSNISVEKLAAFKEEVEGYTNGSYTDILLGLPGETMQSHLDSYYGALRMGFDQIGGGEVRLLPGSEMDEVSSREEYGLKTKFRISEGDVGVYDGDLVYELEEVVRETNWMTEDEMLRLRSIRALLYTSLTLGELAPLNKLLLAHDINILNILRDVVENRDRSTSFSKLLDEFDVLSKNEWYGSEDEITEYFQNEKNKESIINNPPMKLNFWLPAKLFTMPNAYDEFMAEVTRAICKHPNNPSSKVVQEVVHLCSNQNFIRKAYAGKPEHTVSLTLSPETVMALNDSGFLGSHSNVLPVNEPVVLSISSRKADSIVGKMNTQTAQPVLHLSSVLQNFGNAIQMSPESGFYPGPSQIESATSVSPV